MTDAGATLAAEISDWPSQAQLVAMFRSEGYAVTAGTYSVRLDDFDHFVFRALGGDLGAGCITADHASTDALIAFAARVSETLARSGVRHRFEIYRDARDLAAYLHHDWPQAG